MSEPELDKKAVLGLLNEILETELAGAVRYTHHSLSCLATAASQS